MNSIEPVTVAPTRVFKALSSDNPQNGVGQPRWMFYNVDVESLKHGNGWNSLHVAGDFALPFFD